MRWDGICQLIRRAKAGDRDAWERICALAHPFLLRRAGDLIGPGWPQRSISDLIQDTWVRAWQYLKGFQGGCDDGETEARFRAWLMQILRHTHLNDRRAAAAGVRSPGGVILSLDHSAPGSEGGDGGVMEVAGDGPTASRDALRREAVELVRRALADLDEEDARIIRLSFFEGLSLKRISETLGLDYEQLRTRFHDLLKGLGRELDGL